MPAKSRTTKTGRSRQRRTQARAQARAPARSPARADERAKRREHLLRAADRAVRRDGPNVSMAEIAAEAGITKPILYRHFGDKGGLYQALADRYVATLWGGLRKALKVEDDPESRIRLTIDAYLELVESEPQAYAFLMHRAVAERPEARSAVNEFTNGVTRRIAKALSSEFERFGIIDAPVEPIAHGMVGMVQLAGDWWIESDRPIPRIELVDQLTNLLWTGFVGMALRERPDVAASVAR